MQNLLIKADSLYGLKYLLDQGYRSKVKLICIDPPYNTGNDSFKYNDRFNHSTWLTFMKNRLEIAKDLLREDGVIFVQIDDNEQSYLKVLMDEIFGRENFVTNIIWRKKTGGGQDAQYFAVEHENILCFKKNSWQIYDIEIKHIEKDFSKVINGKKAKLLKLEKWGAGQYKYDAPTLHYSIKDPDGIDFYPKASDGEKGRWRKKPENLDEKHIHWEKRNNQWKPYEVIYFHEVDTKKVKTRTILLENSNNTEATKEIVELFQYKVFATPKPESLIQRIIEMSTTEGDIVLDFFAGSGTTPAVAHKMKRQWIAIEQMDYIEDITKLRLQKVIDGEQGGISKALNWQGGGSFDFIDLTHSRVIPDA
jgi:adenine-specific DNA-methyltransferase